MPAKLSVDVVNSLVSLSARRISEAGKLHSPFGNATRSFSPPFCDGPLTVPTAPVGTSESESVQVTRSPALNPPASFSSEENRAALTLRSAELADGSGSGSGSGCGGGDGGAPAPFVSNPWAAFDEFDEAAPPASARPRLCCSRSSASSAVCANARLRGFAGRLAAGREGSAPRP